MADKEGLARQLAALQRAGGQGTDMAPAAAEEDAVAAAEQLLSGRDRQPDAAQQQQQPQQQEQKPHQTNDWKVAEIERLKEKNRLLQEQVKWLGCRLLLDVQWPGWYYATPA